MNEIGSKVKEGGLNDKSQRDEFNSYWVWCFTCGEKFCIRDCREQKRYESTGVCTGCEEEVIRENDPILSYLEKIDSGISEIREDLQKIIGGRNELGSQRRRQ